MTEKEWLTSKNVADLLAAFRFSSRDRKRRLLDCAFARRVLHLLPDRRFQEAIAASEDFADGKLTWEQMKTTFRRDVVAARDALISKGMQIAIQDAASGR